jgi:RES domain-containing protein
MSENRSLAVLEILVHLSSSLPDKYVLGAAAIPDDIPVERVNPDALHDNWMTLLPREQLATRRIGDEWVEQQQTAVLAVPSVIVGELNYVLNPAHRDFGRISFAEPVPFSFDVRLISQREPATTVQAAPSPV